MVTPPTVYIAGPMSGRPEYNYPAFFAAEDALVKCGFKVLNPARVPKPSPDKVAEFGGEYEYYLRRGFELVLRSHLIFVLPEWHLSPGARREVILGRDWLKMGVYELRDVLNYRVLRDALLDGQRLRSAEVVALPEAHAQAG